jgi:hypothetical protein
MSTSMNCCPMNANPSAPTSPVFLVVGLGALAFSAIWWWRERQASPPAAKSATPGTTGAPRLLGYGHGRVTYACDHGR